MNIPRLYRTGDAWGCWLEGFRLGFGETAAEAYSHWIEVNKEAQMIETVEDKRLPKASILWAQWHWWWLGQVWDARLNHRNYPGFVMSTRGANFFQVWIGPLTMSCRRPWLRGPAEQYLKQHYLCE